MKNLNWIVLLVVLFGTTSISKGQNIVWEKTYSLPWDQSIESIEKIDSGFFIFGNGDYLVNQYSELLKADSFGNLLWRKPLFGDIAILSGSYHMERVPYENTFILSGTKYAAAEDYLMKVDINGDSIWEKNYDYTGFHQSVRKFLILKDKSIVTVGFNQYAATNWDVIARRVDSMGNTLWETNYPMPGVQDAFDITEMMDGSMIIAGRTGGDNLLLRIGFDGRLIDQVTQNMSANTFSTFTSLTPNNGIIQTGIPNSASSTFQNLNIFFDTAYILTQHLGLTTNKAFVDNNTNMIVPYFDGVDARLRYSNLNAISNIWDISLGTISTNNYKSANGLIYTGSGQFVAFGRSRNSSERDYWLAKIDGVGEEWIPDPCAFSPPVAGFAYDFNGGIFTLQDTSYAGLPYLDTIYTWDWTLSDGFTSNLESPVTLLDTTTTKTLDIQLIVSNWYGCKDTINQTLNFGPTGITSDIQFEEKVWPNPARDVLNISLSDKPGQSVLFEIFDVHGRVQKSMSFKGTEATLNISSLPQGIYFYKLSAGSAVKRGKVVKG